MSTPENLEDLYIEELGDLWSANEQMEKVVRDMAHEASDADLRDRLGNSADRIREHTQEVRKLLDECGEEGAKEHCKGMEGLVREARKHALATDIKNDEVRDVAIIAQYQRMCHYGLAGFGTAHAFANALEMSQHADTLNDIVESIYEEDEFMSNLAERSVNLSAANGV